MQWRRQRKAEGALTLERSLVLLLDTLHLHSRGRPGRDASDARTRPAAEQKAKKKRTPVEPGCGWFMLMTCCSGLSSH